MFGHNPHTVELHPYFVKEFHNRWYVVGYAKEKNDIRTYALDRIGHISPCSIDFIANTTIDPEDYFKDCIGINFVDRTIELVKLSFTPAQGNYVKTQHLHRSQVILEDSQDEVIVHLNLIINHELKMLILSFGDQVKVLEPYWLAEDIANVSRNVVSSYKELFKENDSNTN
jgi:predicted DNA-binding transcriptional regulator YafY